MDIVSVVFQNKKDPCKFEGREYNYKAAIPLNIGEIVIVPTKNGEGKAKVVQTSIKESEIRFDPNLLKTIESLADEQAENKATAPTF